MAGKRNAANKRPSMFEVAKMAGVSHQTVSRVINHSPDVSDATREKVQKAIDALGYRPSNSARALASHRSRTIGLVAGGQRFYGPISAISSIEAMARQHGLFMSVSMVHEALCSQTEFDELCSTFDEMNVDAFIFLTPTDVMFSAACRAQITQPRVIVTSTHGSISVQDGLRLMKPADRRRVSVVGVDQWSAMADGDAFGGRAWASFRALFRRSEGWRDAATRLMAWNKLCAANAVSSVTVQCETWESTEAYGKMNHILENIGRTGGNLPTCMVCANDSQAVGVSRALHEHGMRIPQDVSLVGFDDMPAMDNMYPPLATVRPDFEQLGVAAMRETLFLLGEGDENSFASSQHGVGLIPAKVIGRTSLGTASRR